MKHDEVGVHATHCCKKHGCKYGSDECPVAYGNIDQEYPCEDCRDGEFDIDELCWRYILAKLSHPSENDSEKLALEIEELIRDKKVPFDSVIDRFLKNFRDRIFPNYR